MTDGMSAILIAVLAIAIALVVFALAVEALVGELGQRIEEWWREGR